MGNSDGRLKISSKDTSSAFSEAYQQLRDNGLTPEELVFRFQCQQCGMRCCMDPHVDTVVFSPYSLAFARHHLPEETMKQLFQLNVLKWEAQPQSAPVFKIGGIVCPFLSLHWDAKAKELFQNNLEKIANSASPELQLILVGILHVLTSIYYDYLRDTGLRDVDVGMPVHGLITVFLSVWDRLTFDRPELYPEDDDLQGKYLVDFYEFLRRPPDPESLFQATCSIWPARPQVCRIFPLGRWIALETTHLTTISN